MDEKELIDIYKQTSKFFYEDKKNSKQKSKHWKRYNIKEFTIENLINFRSYNNLSEGLDDQTDNFTFKFYSKLTNIIPESYILNNLPTKNIGNSKYLIPYKDVLVDFNKLIHIYWFWIVENNILNYKKIFNICEIGGGFASFSELFLKNYDVKLFLIDLPEANLMSTYYLQKNFPQKKFYLFNDYKKNNFLSKLDFEKNDIIILPPNCNIDEKIRIDFFINTRSMMEMDYEVINSYFKFIQNYIVDGGYFLNINRYEKDSVGQSIKISEYPYDNHWKAIISEPSFNQNWIHFLLTQRTFIDNESNIFEELNNIKIIGKKYHGRYIDRIPRFIFLKKFLKKMFKIIFGIKFLNRTGYFFLKIGTNLKNIK